jgi:pimeloyl-ACP methyl ester carboxylesterase
MSHVTDTMRTFISVLLALTSACSATTTGLQKGPEGTQQAQVEQISIQSRDGAPLTGELDLPASASGKLPVVLMIQGEGPFDRDSLVGNSKTPRDLLFRELAQAINAAGLAALRFDHRGLHCNWRTVPPCPTCSTKADSEAWFNQQCWDNRLRGTVNLGTLQDDVAAFYEYARHHPRLDADRIIVLAHSEGTIITSLLVGDQRISPRAIILIGAILESPASLVRWFRVGRKPDGIAAMNANGDGLVTNEEIRAGHATGMLSFYPIEGLLPKSGQWTQDDLKKMAEENQVRFEELRKEVFSHPASEPQPVDDGRVEASWGKVQDMLQLEKSMAEHLSAYRGGIICISGSNDAQVPLTRQRRAYEELASRFARPIEFIVLPGLGHVLGPNPTVGPMDPAAQEKVVELLRRVSQVETR